MSEVSFVVFAEAEEIAEALQQLLEHTGKARVTATVTSEDAIEKVLERERPAALLVDLGHAPHVTLDRIAELTKPSGGFVVCGPRDDSEVILRAFKQGAREFLSSSPDEAEVAEVVEKLSHEVRSVATEATEAPVIAVMGAKGGVGATLVACQVASGLQLIGRRTAVVDLNFPLGDVALHFDLDPTYTLSDVVNASDQIDEALVGDLLQKHAKTGVEILAGPSRVEDAELIQESHVDAVLHQLRARFDRVVIDVSRCWNPTSVRALDQADIILLVALQDVPSLNHARAHRDLLLRLGVSPSRIRTVINRYTKDAGVSDEDLARFLGSSPDFCIPNDYATSILSVNEGRPISDVAPGSAIDTAFRALSSRSFEWLGLPCPDEATDKKNRWGQSLFRRFGKK
ncbi:MAG: AAA family ATPase [Deltaproteobacteria bacterium]|jgi:pilus assembly protein CpaE|nr:AAA family ATPase [Deltaproteobacteria bacterium]